MVLPPLVFFPSYWAWSAVRYTRDTLGVPSNKLGNESEYECVRDLRAKVESETHDSDRAMVKRLAGLAKAGKCGNCGEYGAVQFEFLRTKRCPFLLELCYYRIGPLDHAFVIINRDPDSALSDPSKWGEDCWIADAWGDNVVRGVKYKTREMVWMGGNPPPTPKITAEWWLKYEELEAG